MLFRCYSDAIPMRIPMLIPMLFRCYSDAIPMLSSPQPSLYCFPENVVHIIRSSNLFNYKMILLNGGPEEAAEQLISHLRHRGMLDEETENEDTEK